MCDLSRSAVIRVLLETRSLPSRLQRALKRQPPGPARPPLALDDMERAGFLLLGERPGHEIVFGTVVQPWKAVTGEEPAPRVEAGRFAAFDTPGYVKVAFNIRVEPYGSGRVSGGSPGAGQVTTRRRPRLPITAYTERRHRTSGLPEEAATQNGSATRARSRAYHGK